MRRLSPLESTYTKEKAVEICLASTAALGFDMTAIPNIRLDLEDRPQKNPRACVIAVRSARGRAPHHARAGRARRLPGVHARGGPRAALRRRRPAALVHLPPHLARPRADGDLLVHPRGGDARARMACAPLRAVRRAGGGERAGDAVPRGAALPPVHGEAPLRARLLVELRRGGWDARRATTRSASPRRRAFATTRATTSPTWTAGSTPPTTSGRGSAPPSSARTSGARSATTGGAAATTGEILRGLFAEGTRPTSEEMAGRLGFDPLDTGPLVADLSAA